MDTSSGNKAHRVVRAGRTTPTPAINRLTFCGLGVVFSPDAREVGLAFSLSFTNAHRYTWKHEWLKKTHAASDIKAERGPQDLARTVTLSDFLWYDLADLHETLNVPRPLLLERINKGFSVSALYKPEGYDRLADARLRGLAWRGDHKSITEWAEETGVSYKTLCARLASPTMELDTVMQNGRALGKHQKKSIMTPDLAQALAMNGVKYQTFYSRIQRGWTEKQAMCEPYKHYTKRKKAFNGVVLTQPDEYEHERQQAQPEVDPNAFVPLPDDAVGMDFSKAFGPIGGAA